MVLLIPALVQCQSENENNQADRTAINSPADVQQFEEVAPDGVDVPPGFENHKWVDILNMAKGQTVNWYMRGGYLDTNNWVSGYVTKQMRDRYGITLIEDDALIRKILQHIGLWEARRVRQSATRVASTTTRRNQTIHISPPLKLNSPMIIYAPNCRPSTIGPNNNDDVYGFAVMQVSCCQKTDKWPSFSLSLQV